MTLIKKKKLKSMLVSQQQHTYPSPPLIQQQATDNALGRVRGAVAQIVTFILKLFKVLKSSLLRLL